MKNTQNQKQEAVEPDWDLIAKENESEWEKQAMQERAREQRKENAREDDDAVR